MTDDQTPVEELRASRARIAVASSEFRERLERELDDRLLQPLVLSRMKVELARRSVKADPESAASTIDEAAEAIDAAIAALRQIAHQTYPRVLMHDGLRAALEEAVVRDEAPATIEVDGVGRYRAEVEAAVYFTCLAALRHAAEWRDRVTIALAGTPAELHFEIVASGAGGDPRGFVGSDAIGSVADHIAALGGTLEAQSGPGSPLRIAGNVPHLAP